MTKPDNVLTRQNWDSALTGSNGSRLTYKSKCKRLSRTLCQVSRFFLTPNQSKVRLTGMLPRRSNKKRRVRAEACVLVTNQVRVNSLERRHPELRGVKTYERETIDNASLYDYMVAINFKKKCIC